MKLPGVEYGPVQGLGRTRSARNYQGVHAAEFAGINELIDTSGKIASAVEERFTNRQTQKAITYLGVRNAEIKDELGSRERFTKEYVREHGIVVEGDDAEEIPGYEVRPKLKEHLTKKALEEAGAMISSPGARDRFINAQLPRITEDQTVYTLEQFKLGRADMLNELDIDLQTLMNRGEHARALIKVDISMMTDKEKRERKKRINNDREVAQVNEIKNHPDATDKDLRALITRLHQKDFENIDTNQRNRLIQEIQDRRERMKVENRAALSHAKALNIVEKNWSPDADPRVVDKAIVKSTDDPDVLARARAEVARLNRMKEDADAANRRDAWNNLIKTGDTSVIDSLNVEETEKDKMRIYMRKRDENRLIDDPELVTNLRRLAAGNEVIIDGKTYEPNDWFKYDLYGVRDRMSVKTYNELDKGQLADIKDRNNFQRTHGMGWEARKTAHFETFMGKESTWTADEKQFYLDSSMLLQNALDRKEEEKGSKLNSVEMEKLIREEMRDRYYYRPSKLPWMKMPVREKMEWEDLEKSGELKRILEGIVETGYMNLQDVTMQNIYDFWLKKNHYTKEPVFKND